MTFLYTAILISVIVNKNTVMHSGKGWVGIVNHCPPPPKKNSPAE